MILTAQEQLAIEVQITQVMESLRVTRSRAAQIVGEKMNQDYLAALKP